MEPGAPEAFRALAIALIFAIAAVACTPGLEREVRAFLGVTRRRTYDESR